jgi:hypothetical protein
LANEGDEEASGPVEVEVEAEAPEEPAEVAPKFRTNADLFNAGLKLGYKSRGDMLTALGLKSEMEIVDRLDAYNRLQQMAGK